MKRSQQMKRPLKNDRGFTLVELLVAATILLVAVLAIATMFPTGRGNVDDAGKRSRAIALARENLEVVKNSAFPPVTGGCLAPTPSGYTCNMNVSLGGTSPNRLATVTVTVGWKGAPRSGNVSLATRIAE
jgi:prepilin-type N-terminal cleavage/methylation domain-containing protein